MGPPAAAPVAAVDLRMEPAAAPLRDEGWGVWKEEGVEAAAEAAGAGAPAGVGVEGSGMMVGPRDCFAAEADDWGCCCDCGWW